MFLKHIYLNIKFFLLLPTNKSQVGIHIWLQMEIGPSKAMLEPPSYFDKLINIFKFLEPPWHFLS